MTGKSEKKKQDKAETDETEQLRTQLSEAQAKADEYLDMARRIQAEFENFRKRTEKENEEFRKYASADILAELLNISDDLERAMEHADQDSELTKGLNGIQHNLNKLLQSKGITEIPCDGKFDANCHEALCVKEGEEDGDIVEVFQKGYRMNDRVLRYSKVMVTKAKKDGEQNV